MRPTALLALPAAVLLTPLLVYALPRAAGQTQPMELPVQPGPPEDPATRPGARGARVARHIGYPWYSSASSVSSRYQLYYGYAYEYPGAYSRPYPYLPYPSYSWLPPLPPSYPYSPFLGL